MELYDAYMSADNDAVSMSDTSIRVSEDLADELYRRKGRSTSYEEYLWQLIAEADGTEHQPSDEPAEAVESVAETDAESLLRSFDLPGTGSKFEARVETTIAFYDYLRACEGEPVSKAELQSVVEDHDLDVGYGSFRSFWTNWIKKNVSQGREENTLARLPGVEMDGDEYVYRSQNE